MSTLTVNTAAASLPVTLAQAKAYLNLQECYDSDELTWTIEAARDLFESMTGRTLIDTVYDLSLDAFADEIVIPRVPVESIDSISYYDGDNAQQTLVVDDYTILSADDNGATLYRRDGVVWPGTYLRPDAVTIQFTAGYGTATTDVEKLCQLGVLAMTSHYWTVRDAVVIGTITSELPWMTRSLVNSRRARWVAGVGA